MVAEAIANTTTAGRREALVKSVHGKRVRTTSPRERAGVSHWCTVRCGVNVFPLLPEVEGASLFHETHDAQGGHIIFLPQHRNRFRPLGQFDKPFEVALGKQGLVPDTLDVNGRAVIPARAGIQDAVDATANCSKLW